ncbi:DUF2922 domain-containing protein [Bacillus sp. BGMRC 2118]|nr:DUF2922 domain-containing protein [Bacillus sp. BGMRC 2118]
MAKTLQLQFINEEEKTVTISIDNPIEPVSPAAIDAAMDTILSANVFVSAGGDLITKKGARVVESNVNEVTL